VHYRGCQGSEQCREGQPRQADPEEGSLAGDPPADSGRPLTAASGPNKPNAALVLLIGALCSAPVALVPSHHGCLPACPPIGMRVLFDSAMLCTLALKGSIPLLSSPPWVSTSAHPSLQREARTPGGGALATTSLAAARAGCCASSCPKIAALSKPCGAACGPWSRGGSLAAGGADGCSALGPASDERAAPPHTVPWKNGIPVACPPSRAWSSPLWLPPSCAPLCLSLPALCRGAPALRDPNLSCALLAWLSGDDGLGLAMRSFGAAARGPDGQWRGRVARAPSTA